MPCRQARTLAAPGIRWWCFVLLIGMTESSSRISTWPSSYPDWRPCCTWIRRCRGSPWHAISGLSDSQRIRDFVRRCRGSHASRHLSSPFPPSRDWLASAVPSSVTICARPFVIFGGQVRVIISAWAQHDVFRACAGASRIYSAQDDFVGGADLLGLNAGLLDVRERAVTATANLVVAANPVVADTWRTRGLETALIPYGVDASAYSDVDLVPVPSDYALGGPVAGFVGHIEPAYRPAPARGGGGPRLVPPDGWAQGSRFRAQAAGCSLSLAQRAVGGT